MNKIKELYSSPTTKILVVKIEGSILTGSPDGSWDNSIKGGSTWDSSEADYGLE